MSNRVANGPAIRAIRQAKNVSLRELAKSTGYDRGHLSRVERGALGSLTLATATANALGCSVHAVTVQPILPYVETGPEVIAQQ